MYSFAEVTTFLTANVVLVVVVSIGIIAYLWAQYPWVMIQLIYRYQYHSLGYSVKHVLAANLRFCYAEKQELKEEKSSILILHGFTAAKEDFLGVAASFENDYHVVLVDLPGHGHTSTPRHTPDLLEMVSLLHAFVERIGLNSRPFHLIGQSFGGAVATVYAATYPEDVFQLTLLCPLMYNEVKTQFMERAEKGSCSLISSTIHDLREAIDLVCSQRGNISDNILAGVLQSRMHQNRFLARVIKSFTEDTDQLKIINNAHASISAPTQVVWGEDDKVLHPSGSQIVRDNISTCMRCILIGKCGHSLHYDAPRKVGNIIENFHLHLNHGNNSGILPVNSVSKISNLSIYVK